MTDVLVVMVTVPSREVGEKLADLLVAEHLAACVNLIGPVRSIYRWQGELCREDEQLLIIKTTRKGFRTLQHRVLAVHPYDTPEIIALSVSGGSRAYLDWVRGATAADPHAAGAPRRRLAAVRKPRRPRRAPR